jgi:ATP-binding cassette subfamily F protein 3
VEETALWHLARIAPGEREQVLRDFLGGFDFRGDQVVQRVESFSGGEKARLALALIVWQRPNLLVLDEPTNHLDIDMREALAQALVDFEGALIVVAHDRHLLAAATDQWMLVADGQLAPFDGDLDDYKRWLRDRKPGTQSVTPGTDPLSLKKEAKAGLSPVLQSSRREERRVEAAARQREAEARKPFEKRLGAIEAELATLTREAQETEAWLASPEAYLDAQRERLQEALRRRGEVQGRIAQLEDEWLWAQAELERAVDAARATPDGAR